jgi:hypothetical protein
MENFRSWKSSSREYEDIFAVDSEGHGQNKKAHCRIDTGGAQPIGQHLGRLSLAEQEELCEMLDDVQRRRVIEESDSPWSSTVVLVRQKMGNSASAWTTEN